MSLQLKWNDNVKGLIKCVSCGGMNVNTMHHWDMFICFHYVSVSGHLYRAFYKFLKVQLKSDGNNTNFLICRQKTSHHEWEAEESRRQSSGRANGEGERVAAASERGRDNEGLSRDFSSLSDFHLARRSSD